jgi:cytochrome c556
MPRLSLKEILSEIAATVGRSHLLEHIENLDGDIAATPEPEKPGEAEEIAAQMAELQKRADEIKAKTTPAASDDTLTEGGK